jgi:hypothetical protein
MSIQAGLSKDKKKRSPKQAPAPAAHPPLLTRDQLLVFLQENGIPMGKSTLDKLCGTSRKQRTGLLLNQGPPVAAWWGNRPLHDREAALAWGKTLLRTSKP